MSGPLTPEQEAVRTAPVSGWTAVEAPAGSGKTRVIIDRVQYLIGQGVPADQILLLTFSRAARDELRKRLEQAKLPGCRVQTLHALARHALSTGGAVQILSADENRVHYRELLADVASVARRIGSDPERELERVWRTLPPDLTENQRRLRMRADAFLATLAQTTRQAHHTFTSLLAALHQQFLDRPDTLRAVQASVHTVIVDEAQDLSGLQAALVEQLASGRSLLLVGDPWQGIYGFQGATPDVLERLTKAADRRLALNVTYRSPAQHVLAAEVLTGRTTVPARGFGGSLEVIRSDSRGELIDALQRVATARSAVDQLAVLVRSNDEVTEVAGHLRDASLEVWTSGTPGRLGDAYCRDVLWPAASYVCARAHPTGRHPLLALSGVETSVPEARRDVALVNAAWQTARQAHELAGRLDPVLDRMLRVWAALEDFHGSPRALLTALTALLGTPPSHVAEHHCQLAADLPQLLVKLSPSLPPDTFPVVVSTIHAAKGLEWPQVLLYDAGHTSYARETPEEMREAVRLRYVALTRSWRDLVAVLHPAAHPAYQRALAPDVVERIHTLERALVHEQPVDDRALRRALLASPAMRGYLERYAARHLSPELLKRLTHVLALPDDAVAPPTLTQSVLRRIPLKGYPRPGG